MKKSKLRITKRGKNVIAVKRSNDVPPTGYIVIERLTPKVFSLITKYPYSRIGQMGKPASKALSSIKGKCFKDIFHSALGSVIKKPHPSGPCGLVMDKPRQGGPCGIVVEKPRQGGPSGDKVVAKLKK